MEDFRKDNVYEQTGKMFGVMGLQISESWNA